MSHGNHILWVESHRSFSEVVARVLHDAGFEVTRATSASEGLELARDGQFDLYFCELVLPGMTGIELSRRIREFDRKTPFLFISARAINDQKLQATACEFLDCCLEPLDFSSLKHTIHALLDSGVDDVARQRELADSGSTS